MVNEFKLTESFIDKYKNKKAPFGFNGLGEVVYIRTYSRLKEDGSNEKWYETIARVINGTYNMQREWVEQNGLQWNAWQAQKSAQEMYDRMFNMKFLPPGRGLWAMGSKLTTDKKIYASLNNCSFVSTENLKDDISKPFMFLMDMSMLGVGVGFDTKGAGTITIKGPNKNRPTDNYEIPDTREGWVESLRMLIESYFLGTHPVEFSYKLIRKSGEPIKGFGGVSSGPLPLIELHKSIRKVLDKEIGQPISITAIVDVMNLIGKCVVSGNVRRTAEIVFGDPKSEEYLDLKNYDINPKRADHGWSSNNSIFAELGMDYKPVAERIKNNGEPGLIWLDNIRKYSRMNRPQDNKDIRASGANPCVEQTLESYETCCLVENFPNNHESLDDFKRTLKFAYLYAKTVTLGKTHWVETNRVMLRNRRIGCSMSGIAQFITNKGLHELKNWMKEGYMQIQKCDNQYSEWLCIPSSIKTTSIKPSGTISLLVGATPGMHYPESRFYIRRIRISKDSELITPLKNAGYPIEDAVNEVNTSVVSFPVDVGKGVKTLEDTNIWEQMSLSAFIQKYWSDNQVSCTVTFRQEEANQISEALNYFQYQLKGISFLPKKKDKVYPQMPYEKIDEETYNSMMKKITKISFVKKSIHNEIADVEKFCSGDVCEIKIAEEITKKDK